MCPATLTTTASLSATDPAIFLHSAAGCTAGRPTAGDAGRSAQAGIPGRSCAGRGRGSENGSGALTLAGARARAWDSGVHPAGRPGGGEGRGGGARPQVGGGGCCPDRGGGVGAASCRRVLLSPPEEERWRGPRRVGPGRHLKAAGARLGNRKQGGDAAGLPQLARLALPLGHWTVEGDWGGRDGPVQIGACGGRGT